MTLFQINQAIENAIMNAVDPETGEITGDLSELDALEMARDEKIENTALYIKNLRAEAKALKEEAKTFTNRARTAENRADSLFNYLRAMLDGEKFKSLKTSISYRKTKAVEISNLSTIPMEFLNIPDPVPDKRAIADAIKAGETVEGAALVERESMIIK